GIFFVVPIRFAWFDKVIRRKQLGIGGSLLGHNLPEIAEVPDRAVQYAEASTHSGLVECFGAGPVVPPQGEGLVGSNVAGQPSAEASVADQVEPGREPRHSGAQRCSFEPLRDTPGGNPL